MSIADLCRLKDAWQAQYPSHARGGDAAIAGFAYQFFEVLLASTRAWLDTAAHDRADPRVFTELLSDIVEQRAGGVIVVTQVKYTQSSAAVIAGLNDLFRIFQVAQVSTPTLASGLDLRILSAHPDLKNVAGTIDRWQPNDSRPVSDVQLAEFRARVRVELNEDPEGELLALLVNKFRSQRPLERVHAWLGGLMAGAGCGEGYQRVSRQIWNDLADLERDRARQAIPSVYVWVAADRPPTRTTAGRVLTGQQPRLRHLREGYFAPRKQLFTGIAERLMSWVSRHHGEQDENLRLPVYWIGGRSGAGKSVALLHVQSHLHQHGVATILQPPSVSHLAATIRWSREMHRTGLPIVIALDDPYAPSGQSDAATVWRDALDELHEVRQAGDSSSIPLLVCCGPSEQADRLQNDMPGDVTVLLDALPHEAPADLLSLRQWYRERTGSDPPEVGDKNVLLVQLFFEWRTGAPLPEFASRLRNRIQALDQTGRMEAALAQTLAVNRLYTGACLAAIESDLSPQLLDGLDRLRQENHLIDDAGPSRSGLWLAHPHLAEAIYSSWFVPSGARVRKEHLKKACLGALRYGSTPVEQTSPLWAISRVLAPPAAASEFAQRLDSPVACRILEEVYAETFRDGRRMPVAHIPVWLELRAHAPNLTLSPDPIDEAIDRVTSAGIDETGLRLTCHKLLEHLDALGNEAQERALIAILGLLRRNSEWRGWVPIAEDLIVRKADPRLWPILAAWAEPRIHKQAAQSILLRALQCATTEPHLSRIALDSLHDAHLTEEWSRIARLLLDSSQLKHSDLLPWVEARSNSPAAAHLVGLLLQHEIAGSEALAMTWASKWRLDANASLVLEPLTAVDPSPQVLSWGRSWIEQRHQNSGYLMVRLIGIDSEEESRALAFRWLGWTKTEDPGWGFVWEALWKQLPGDVDLTALAIEWLAEVSANHGSWGFVWELIWKHSPGLPIPQALARNWLEVVSPNHGSWGHVWKALWKSSTAEEFLVRQARKWLGAVRPGHDLWRAVWEAVWKVCSNDRGFEEFSFKWLSESPAEDVSWGYVWLELWNHRPDDRTLETLAHDWLMRVSAKHGSWQYVWQALWNRKIGDSDLATFAREWLLEVPPTHPSWQYVWSSLWQCQKDDETLKALARKWLQVAPPEHGSWGHVWEAMWELDPGDPMLISLADVWLANVPAKDGSWAFVWEKLWKSQACDEALTRLALEWLASAPAKHGSWRHVWQAMWKRQKGDETLRQLACDWLAKARVYNNSWIYVWEALWAEWRGDKSLVKIARGWLERTPAGHRAWGFNWEAMWQHLPGEQALSILARTWLSKAPADHGSWKYVWEALWMSDPRDPELKAIAHEWLVKAPLSHGSWGFVWQEIWKSEPRNPAMRSLAIDWLAMVPEGHGSWGFVWLECWNARVGNEVLARLARKWLSSVSPLHGSWRHVWGALWKLQTGDRELVNMGRTWLARVPPGHPPSRQVRRALQDRDARQTAPGSRTHPPPFKRGRGNKNG